MARPGATQHRKFLRLARTLGSEPLALGCLEFMWQRCYQNGDDYLGDVVDVEAAAHWDGEPGKLCAALLAAGGDGNHGLIDEPEDRPGHYRCHDLFDHAPDYVSKRRTRELERKKVKACSECGDPFHSSHRSAKFCSDACRTAAWRKGKNGHVKEHVTEREAVEHRKAAPVTECDATETDAPVLVTDCDGTPAPAPAPALKTVEEPSSSEAIASDQVMADSDKKQNSPPSKEARQLAELLKDEILHYKPDHRPITNGDLNCWAKTADLMIRTEGRSPKRIAAVIQWVQADAFNRATVLSMGKLRKRFDELETRSRQKGGHGNGNRNRAEQRTADNIAAVDAAFPVDR